MEHRNPPEHETRDDAPRVRIPERVELIIPGEGRRPGSGDRPPLPERPRNRNRLALGLFLATCVCTTWAWPNWFGYGPVASDASVIDTIVAIVTQGLRYSIPVMLILISHEMGHYLQARRYGVPASLPFFIPMPFGPLGTMGAVIVQGAGVADRKQMFDIAVSGPLAGLVLALPIAWFGVAEASVVPKAVAFSPGNIHFGDPLLLTWMTRAIHGTDQELLLTPLLFAGWVGIFITALNLIPIGQLDGGHILYCLIGRRQHLIAMLVLAGAVGFMFITQNFNYILIVMLLLVFGPRHPPTANDAVPLGWVRIVLGWVTLGFILVGFTPVPIDLAR